MRLGKQRRGGLQNHMGQELLRLKAPEIACLVRKHANIPTTCTNRAIRDRENAGRPRLCFKSSNLPKTKAALIEVFDTNATLLSAVFVGREIVSFVNHPLLKCGRRGGRLTLAALWQPMILLKLNGMNASKR